MSAEKKIVIIGAGPCGLGAGWSLKQRGYENWVVLERNPHIGGLSASFTDDAGFTWDIGGHVLFSHFGEFDDVIGTVMNGEMIDHARESFVRCLGRWVKYPFQNNLHHLPPQAQYDCLIGLNNNKMKKDAVTNFEEWIDCVFGEGIARHFMRPYNEKVWAVPLSAMSYGWIGERVSVIDFESVLKDIILGKPDDGWGPNAQFSFPRVGGTGEIFRRIASRFQDNIRLNTRIQEISVEKKLIRLGDGSSVHYDHLISTMPLDGLFDLITDSPASLKEASQELMHNSVLVVGLGFSSQLEDDERCWFYFPGHGSPFYRVTNFAKYSPNNVPGGKVELYSSYMCETSYSPYKEVDKDTIIEKTKRALLEEELITEEIYEKEVSRYLIDVDYAYPVPTTERDRHLKELQAFLMDRDVFSRGRFGAWRYEIGNMDHSFKMGLEVAGLITDGTPEQVWRSE